MNKDWSELNKLMQVQLKKSDAYKQGISTLISLRKMLLQEMKDFRTALSKADFSAMPCPEAKGYHNKTIAYSLWHIFRIEDIVAHTLIAEKEQIFFSEGFDKRIKSPIITTGNELLANEIKEFSEKLDIDELYNYIESVDESVTNILNSLSFDELKVKISEDKKKTLKALKVVSENENAVWLIDYWCNKDVRGLIQMPLSRHWIMHIEASRRIKEKLR